VQLGDSYSNDEMYGETYGYRSGLNNSMVSHLERLSKGLIRLLNLESSDIVVDIGANDGTLINFFSDRGIQAVGIDPTSAKYREFFHKDVLVLESFFNVAAYEETKLKKAKLVTSIAMFYDLEKPIQFARDVHSILADDGYWFLEQSYAPWMRQSGAYDTICHEHLEYYSLSNIRDIMSESGFTIVKVTTNNINGGSFGVLVRKTSALKKSSIDPYVDWLFKEEAKGNNLEDWMNFTEHVLHGRNSLRELIEGINQSGERIAALGASTKGNVLLNFTGLDSSLIESVGEVNPYKFGRLTPGSNIPILPENQVIKSNPDYLIFLPWHFKESALIRYEKYLISGGKLLFPLPDIEILGF